MARIEPALQGTEDELVRGFLDRQRATFLRKIEGLDHVQLARRIEPSSLTLAGLTKHLAYVEDHWFQTVLVGAPGPEPWVSAPWDDDPDWEMTTADGRTFAALADDFSAACDRSRVTLATHHDLDLVAPGAPPGRPVTLRWILIHMIEEYARHCGHADLLREAVDGRTDD